MSEKTTNGVWHDSDSNDRCPKCKTVVQHQMETKTIDGHTDFYIKSERCPKGCYETAFNN